MIGERRLALLGLGGVVLLLAGVSEAGTTAVWTSTNARITNDGWGTPGLWADDDGNALTVAPTDGSAHYDIKLTPVTTEVLPGEDPVRVWLAGQKHVKQVTTGQNSGQGGKTTVPSGSVDPVVDSIGADDVATTHRYVIYQAPFNGDQYTWALARSFSVRDPNGFKGLFRSNNANVTWEFRAEPDFTPEVYGIDTTYGPRIRVPAAGTVAQVCGVSRTGCAYKHGAGTLAVTGGGSDGHYIVEEGALRLNGGGATEDALVKSLLSEALLHLDASDESSVVTRYAEGRVWFSRWDDVRKNGVCAYPDPPDTTAGPTGITAPNPAFLSDQVSPTGLFLADFGRLAKDAGEGDVTNCYMRLSTSFAHVRDAVFVAAFPYGTENATVLGGTSTYDWMSDNTYGRLFSCGYAPYAVAYGKFAVNGAPCTYDDLKDGLTDWKQVNVIHAQPNADTCVSLLGSDRLYASKHGNSRVGEILLFDRELTVAERTAIDRHLIAKWIDGQPRSATGVLLQKNTAIDVAAGAVAHVGRVTAADKTVVKTGGGTLEVSEIASDDQVFDVRGGSVRFAACPDLDTRRPGGNPWIWLDASEDATLTTNDNGVTQWADRRGNSRMATAVSPTSSGTLPTKDTVGCNGRQTLDLGTGADAGGVQSYFKLPNAKTDTYAGFMVLRFNTAAHYLMFGSSDMTFYRTAGKIGNGDETGRGAYVQREVTAAYWSINGTQRSPFAEQDELKRTDEYFVIGFRSAVPLTCDRIAVDRDTGDICGNLRVGEFITYHEPISADEFNQTEAYLMKKWLAQVHPANRAKVGELKFADGADKVIDTDRDLTMPIPAGGADKIVKKGAGVLTLKVKPWTAKVPSVEVRGGSVNVFYDAAGDDYDGRLTAEALFRFDASDFSTLDCAVDGTVTNVTFIADVRKNGIRGRSALDAGFRPATRHPQWTVAETRDGVARPVLDFFKTCYSGQAAQDAAALLLQKDGKDTVFNTVREVFLVVAQNADAVGLRCNSWFSADFGSTALKWGRNDYDDPSALVSDFPKYVYPGLYADGSASVGGVDGKATELKFGSADGFQLVELRPGEDASAAVFAAERENYAVGGYKLGEMVAFPRELTADERDCLRASLRMKWFGETPPAPPAPPVVALTVGETLAFTGLKVPTTMALAITVPNALAEGTYTVLTSDLGFETSDASQYKVTVDNPSRRLVTVEIDGTVMKVSVARPGLLVMLGTPSHIGEGEDASLSPDGSKLLFSRRLPSGVYNVGVRNLVTGRETWLGDGRGHAVHPAWGPDGSVVFSHCSLTNTAYEAYRLNVADGWNICRWQGGETKRLTGGHYREYAPSVSPDGRFVYFTSTRAESTTGAVLSNRAQMFRVAADGKTPPEHLWGPSNLDTSAAANPHVSPDGRCLVWAQTDDASDTWRIRIARLDDLAHSAAVTPRDMYAYSPRWNPDGKRIAFAATTFEFPAWGIWIVDPLKDKMIRVADGMNPSFTADGSAIVYDCGGRIYLKRLDGTAAVVRPAGIVRTDEPSARTFCQATDVAPKTVIPLSAEAEVGTDDFWIVARIRTGASVAGYQFVCKLRYGGREDGLQLFIIDGRVEFATRTATGSYAPLKSTVRIEPNRDYVFVGHREGECLRLSVDGAQPEKAFVTGIFRFGAPQAMILGPDYYDGSPFAGELKYVAFGTGCPADMPSPPSVGAILGEEDGK